MHLIFSVTGFVPDKMYLVTLPAPNIMQGMPQLYKNIKKTTF